MPIWAQVFLRGSPSLVTLPATQPAQSAAGAAASGTVCAHLQTVRACEDVLRAGSGRPIPSSYTTNVTSLELVIYIPEIDLPETTDNLRDAPSEDQGEPQGRHRAMAIPIAGMGIQ